MKNLLEQLQTALSPLPYLSFKTVDRKEILLLLSAITCAELDLEGHLVITFGSGHRVQILDCDLPAFSKALQEGIDLAVSRNSQAQMQALLAQNKIIGM